MISVLIAGAMMAPRTIQFSGFEWEVKRAEHKVGPGPNFFSDAPESVFVDDQGRLHMKVRKTAQGWTSSEVYLNKPLGYGKYTFEVDTPAKEVDDQMVLGLFTYGESEDYYHREIDVEISRWADPKFDNTQFVIQPYEVKENIQRFELAPEAASSVHSFEWRKEKIDFKTAAPGFEKTWSYEGKDNPVPGDETVHINLWLFEGKAPAADRDYEMVIRKFTFTP